MKKGWYSLLGIAAVFCIGISAVLLYHYGVHIAPQNTAGDSETLAGEIQAEEISYVAPDEMKAVEFYPEQVLEKAGDETAIANAVDSFLDSAVSLEMNTVVIHLPYKGGVIDSCHDIANPLGFDVLAYLLDICGQKNLYTYVLVDLTYQSNGDTAGNINILTAEQVNNACNRLSELAYNYAPTAFVVYNPGVTYSGAAYTAYRQQGGGIGYENWLRQVQNAAVLKAVSRCKQQYPAQQIGVLVDSVWARADQREDGVAATDITGSMDDYFVDTALIASNNAVDFVVVDMPYPTGAETNDFATLFGWWKEKIDQKPVYARLHNDLLFSDQNYWRSPDQMIMQVMAVRNLQGSGVIFNSLHDLLQDKGGSTTALLAYYKNSINENLLEKQLTINNPDKENSVTYNTTLNIYGGGDPSFDFLMNGEEIQLNEEGLFSKTVELKVGTNTFEFEHKGVKKTYTVTRKVQIISSCSPVGSAKALSGTSIAITAYCYADSRVTATLGGTTITLNQTDIGQDEGVNDQYKMYTGNLTLPSVTVDKQLGNIVINASWNGYSETSTGASVTVLAPADSTPSVTPPTEGGESGGTVSGNLAKVIAADGEAEGYNPNTLTNYSDPNYYGLAIGGYDFVVSSQLTCTDAGYTDTYYLLGSGIRVESRDISIQGQKSLAANQVSAVRFSFSGNDFLVSIDQSWAAPYRISVDGNRVVIRLYYKTAEKPTLSLPSGSPFSSAQWGTVDGCDAIILTGGVRGVSSYYSGNTAVISFKRALSSGLTVYIDPGHGGTTSSGVYDGGAYIYNLREADLNLGIANATATALRAKGYKVVVGSRPYALASRYKEAQNNNADVFISIHNNVSTVSSTAKGTECYYFNDFSKTLAQNISSAVAGALQTTNRGGMFGYYGVTRHTLFPAVLVECGFMSNAEEAQKLKDPSYQQKIGQAIANAVAATF